MSIQLKLRRGTAVENAVFTGAEGELTYSTDTKELRIHDGSTIGGLPVDVVVAWQKPTAENGYTWYRKYASGWVEQGGRIIPTAENRPSVAVTLPMPMADGEYICTKTHMWAKSQEAKNTIYQSNAQDTTKNTATTSYWSCLSTTYIEYEAWKVEGYVA